MAGTAEFLASMHPHLCHNWLMEQLQGRGNLVKTEKYHIGGGLKLKNATNTCKTRGLDIVIQGCSLTMLVLFEIESRIYLCSFDSFERNIKYNNSAGVCLK